MGTVPTKSMTRENAPTATKTLPENLGYSDTITLDEGLQGNRSPHHINLLSHYK